MPAPRAVAGRPDDGSRARPSFAEQGIWALIAAPEDAILPAEPAALAAAARRFAELVSPALAAAVLGPVEARIGTCLIDAEARAKSRLLNRFTYHAQRDCAAAIAGAGIDAVYLKGFANAHLLYDEPEVRAVGDIDVLVRTAALESLLGLLSARGFRFRRGAGRPWGFVSSTSFLPFVSADGACNLDIHIQPDAYPVDRSLDAEAVFAAARPVAAGGLEIRVPSREHGLVLAASNAAKDKFGPFCARKLLDSMVLLRRAGPVDWAGIEDIARRGGYLRPVRAFVGMLRRLGAAAPLPPGLAQPFAGAAGVEFERVVQACRDLFPAPMGPAGLLRREFLLTAGPAVGLHNNWRRLRGLVRPHEGLPPGARNLLASAR